MIDLYFVQVRKIWRYSTELNRRLSLTLQPSSPSISRDLSRFLLELRYTLATWYELFAAISIQMRALRRNYWNITGLIDTRYVTPHKGRLRVGPCLSVCLSVSYLVDVGHWYWELAYYILISLPNWWTHGFVHDSFIMRVSAQTSRGYIKVSTHIKFDELLDLSPYCSRFAWVSTATTILLPLLLIYDCYYGVS